MGNKKMEVFVNLTKKDMVVSVEEKILPESLVFESLNPFPGYYHELPTDPGSMYIYLVLNKQYPLEEILRTTQAIENQFDWSFDAGKAYLTIGSTSLDAIRLKHLPSLDMLVKIQEAYVEQGIQFLKNKKMKGKLEANVKIVKFLELEKLAEGIFMNVQDSTFAYIEIPKYLSNEDFTKVSMDVKYNWDGHEFDAASASFYIDGTLYEAVRIFSDKMDLEYLAAIKKLYADKMD
ncbi:hypothetical protein SLH46_19265 [Draconibacterium sp. IB214405]|uniref:hypothetical protein n=1 Tax=Draconibacterium sp. IB214405 TaxID=3097352 RepID=UPI002A102E83|nr:hypothetical protein [Draconibacterium sp. IB214405]MDX8341347.1 hypothetical protein [Draconibacterium sp. IB214405]